MKVTNHWKLTEGQNYIIPFLSIGFNKTQFIISILGFSFAFGTYIKGVSEFKNSKE